MGFCPFLLPPFVWQVSRVESCPKSGREAGSGPSLHNAPSRISRCSHTLHYDTLITRAAWTLEFGSQLYARPLTSQNLPSTHSGE
jgi:hypothetical protein